MNDAVQEPEVLDPATELAELKKKLEKIQRKNAEIDGAEKRTRELASMIAELAVQSKEAKASHAAAVLRLCQLVRERDQEMIPFEELDAQAEGAADPEAWRERPIAELDLTPGQVTKLEEAGVTTIGQLEDLRAGNIDYPRGLQDVKGFGEKAITDIEAKVLEWLDKNRDNLAAIAGEGEEEAEEEEAEQPELAQAGT